MATKKENATNKNGLKDALKALMEGFDDLTSLTVVTLVGDLTFEPATDGKPVDWDSLLDDKLKATDGKLTLAAMTHMKADYDTVNVRASGDFLDEQTIRLHEASVKAAREGREAVMRLGLDFFSDLVPKPTK